MVTVCVIMVIVYMCIAMAQLSNNNSCVINKVILKAVNKCCTYNVHLVTDTFGSSNKASQPLLYILLSLALSVMLM